MLLAREAGGAEKLHPLHERNRLLGPVRREEGGDLAERFAQELGREPVQFGTGVRVGRVDADNRAEDGQRLVLLTCAHRLAVIPVERVVLADLLAVEAAHGDDLLVIEREARRQAAFAAERMPPFRFGEAQLGAQAQQVGFRFGHLEGRVLLAAADQARGLFKPFARSCAEGRVLARE